MANRSTKRADGRLVRTITDPQTGKRKYFYGETEREINKQIMAYTAKIEDGRPFEEVAEEWWSDAEPNLQYQSVKVYRPALRRSVEAFKGVPIQDITPRDISRLMQRMAAQGFGQKTVANQRTVLNQIFRHAVVEGDIQSNPCADVSAPKNLKKEKRGAASETDERIVRENRDLWCLPYLALMTGMRKGEILALQWRDIDFKGRTINVTKSVSHKGDRPVIKSTKTEAGTRIVPLLDELRDFLLTMPERKPDRFIVSDDGTKPLTNRRYITLWKHYQAQTGIESTAHQLRHSFVTIAFEAGVDPKSIQEIVGHKQLSTTLDIYTDFRKSSVQKAADILNQKTKKGSQNG